MISNYRGKERPPIGKRRLSSWTAFLLALAAPASLWADPPNAPAPSSNVSSPAPTASSSAPPAPAFDAGSALASVGTTSPETSPGEGLEANHLIATQQPDAAERLIVAQLMKTHQDPEWMTLLGEVRIGQGREGEAVRLLQQADQLGGVTALRAELIGVAECIWHREDLAEPEFRQAIKLDPFNPTPHYFLARLLYARGLYDEAIQESKNAFSLAPGFVRAYENLGLCYEGKLDNQQAEYWFREAIRRNASSTTKTEWPALDLAQLLIRQNRIPEAKSFLEQAIAINPGNAQSLQQMGLLLERQGDYKGALQSFSAAIKADPKMEAAYYQASQMAKKVGDSAQAQEYLSKFQELHQTATHNYDGSTLIQQK